MLNADTRTLKLYAHINIILWNRQHLIRQSDFGLCFAKYYSRQYFVLYGIAYFVTWPPFCTYKLL